MVGSGSEGGGTESVGVVVVGGLVRLESISTGLGQLLAVCHSLGLGLGRGAGIWWKRDAILGVVVLVVRRPKPWYKGVCRVETAAAEQ